MPAYETTVVFAVLIGSLVLFTLDLLRYELVALLVPLALALSGALTAQQAFAGFGSPALVMIASMYVFAEAVTRWGIAQAIGQRFLIREGQHEVFLIVRVCLVGGLLSALISDTAVTACLMPIVIGAAHKAKISPSRLLIPLSFSTLLGGMITVMGTSTNIAINSTLEKLGRVPLGLFEFTPVGLGLLGLGIVYFLGPGRWLLPKTKPRETLVEQYRLPSFVTELEIEPSSSLINRAVGELPIFEQHNISVVGLLRSGGEGTVLAPGPYNRIRRDDVLILQGERESILRVRTELSLRERATQVAALDSADVSLLEAVIPAESPLIGHTLAQADFRSRTGLNVLAIAKAGHDQPQAVGHTELDVGDTLLIQGHAKDISRAREGREVLLLAEIPAPPIGRGALITALTLAAVLLLSSLTPIPLAVASLAGALLLVLTRVVRAQNALASIDWSVLILLGGMLALGDAFERHGLALKVAELITGVGSLGAHPGILLGVLLVSTALLTQVIANVSAGVIMTPVALSIAAQSGLEARPFLVAVVIGASTAFMTPVGHQANSMVTGPGGYRYNDFVRVGSPLSVAVLCAAALLIPIVFPFQAL
jgi:di/tricarboxylate transporter